MAPKFILAGLLLFSSSAGAESVSTSTYYSISFKEVNVVGASECNLNFYNALVDGELMKITVGLDNVEIALLEPDNFRIVTTLDVISARSDLFNDWLSAERVVVYVRSKDDFRLWNKFLEKAKKRREGWRRHLHQPSRVIPP